MSMDGNSRIVQLRHAAVHGRGGRVSLQIEDGRLGTPTASAGMRIDLRDHRIYPGLINAHDHLHLNALPAYRPRHPFANSYEWIEAFQVQFRDPATLKALALPKALRLRHGALKNLLSGVTFVAHHDSWEPMFDASDFPVSVLRDAGWCYAPGWPMYGPAMRQSFLETPAGRPWMIHLAEGTDEKAHAELTALDAQGCLSSQTVMIHGVGLSLRDMDRIIASHAAVVWCPTSNLRLLGATLEPTRLAHAGRLALGTDSRLTGADDLLDELCRARAYSDLPASRLIDLVTERPARILGSEGRGHLAPGACADLVIVPDRGEGTLVGLARADIRMVVRDGLPQWGDPMFAAWFEAAGVPTTPVFLDGQPKLLATQYADPVLLALEPGLTATLPITSRDVRKEARC
ncbi:amidohydrolase [Dyella terrae]|uniref:Amidohydrolase n=3 Tax=Rhodanobacteraceae TaxID=1775411 RepID=A0A4R0YZS4_9GAMM|nr:amidohydrolase [Dyella terrae]TCI12949.1 amidohydrolase [Dyella soli]